MILDSGKLLVLVQKYSLLVCFGTTNWEVHCARISVPIHCFFRVSEYPGQPATKLSQLSEAHLCANRLPSGQPSRASIRKLNTQEEEEITTTTERQPTNWRKDQRQITTTAAAADKKKPIGTRHEAPRQKGCRKSLRNFFRTAVSQLILVVFNAACFDWKCN